MGPEGRKRERLGGTRWGRLEAGERHTEIRMWDQVGNVQQYLRRISYKTVGCLLDMAEREGFEPSIGFHLYTLSRRAP